jgi:flagellar biosynthesis protein FliQ
MTQETVMTLGQGALTTTLMLCAPVLLVSLVIGLVVSIFQAITSINEMTLAFIPKVAGIFAVLLVLGPWMTSTRLSYTRGLFLRTATLPH